MERKLECNELETRDMKGWIVHDGEESEQWIYANRTTNKYNKLFSTPFLKLCKEVFLPEGFPESVHSDYVPYQIWDTVQAFASTILGTLTTHSIMRGVGVGDSTATPLAAAITWILKDGTGMVGRILFAWWNGTELDAQCKKWRLFADVVNDAAMGIELFVPYFSSYTTAVLCVSSGMKSLVGVAGGATRAAITQHQALRNNLADVSAKDGSQETCVNLIASLVGIFILSYLNVSSFLAVYYVILVIVHIYANYSAVRSLRFETFNENRLALVVKNYLTESVILSPKEINERESLMFFQRPSRDLCGFDIVMGGSFDKLFESIKADNDRASLLTKMLKAYKSENYKKLHSAVSEKDIHKPVAFCLPVISTRTIYVALENNDAPSDIIDAYFEAFVTGMWFSMELNLRADIIREAKRSVGPLISLYKGTPEGSKDESVTARHRVTALKSERQRWSNLLEKSEWFRTKGLMFQNGNEMYTFYPSDHTDHIGTHASMFLADLKNDCKCN